MEQSESLLLKCVQHEKVNYVHSTTHLLLIFCSRSLVQRIEKLEKTTDSYRESQARIKADREANDKFHHDVTTRWVPWNVRRMVAQAGKAFSLSL